MSSARQPQKQSLTGTYTFSSRPRPVQTRSRYRDPPEDRNDGHVSYGNIMYDRRVVRGNTYAQPTIPEPGPADPADTQQTHKRSTARKRTRGPLRPRTPEAVAGRTHVDVQTELYLEELGGQVEVEHADCQTDAFMDKPATPRFVPAKTGTDAATQVLEGELFDFEGEVKPVLEVLVGKTMEQSLLEVMEEEEMTSLLAQQRSFHQLRYAEVAEVRRLEEQERRQRQEKGRRVAQQRMALETERETLEKVGAWTFTQHYLAELLTCVHSRLRDHGYFYDPVERDIQTSFFPWLMAEVRNNLDHRCVSRDLLDTLILEVTEKRLDGFQKQEI